MTNWKPQKLGEIADVKLSNVDKKTSENEREVRLCNYTDVYKNSFIDSLKAVNFMVASCNENEFEKFILKKGQVAITKDSEKRDDIGIATYISEDFEDVVLGYHLSLITPEVDKLNGKFLYYWFNSKQAKNYFENNAGGSGQRCTLPIDIIKSIKINLPNLETQQKIAAVLSALDDKIELNNQINTELEAMAKTLYDYWFVQFDFPDENGQPYKSSGGKMVFNGTLKREIPVGWEVKSLEDVCEIINGYAFKSEWYQDSGKKIIRTKNFDNGYITLNDLVYLSESKAKEFKKYELQNFDFLMVMVGASTGKYCTVNSNILPALQNQNMWRFKSIDKNQFFINALLQNVILELENTTNGSARGFFQKGTFLEKQICYPSGEILNQFKEIISPIYFNIDNNLKQNQELAQLRDWLLPMLMNGQVRVGENDEEVLGLVAEK